jgi:hypothetical protein
MRSLANITQIAEGGWFARIPSRGQFRQTIHSRVLASDVTLSLVQKGRLWVEAGFPSRSCERPLSVRVSDAGAVRAALPGVRGPASESLRKTNPRDSGEQLAVYGELAGQRRWWGMVLRRLVRAESS